MLWNKGVCANDALADVPLQAFPHLDTKLIGTGLQVTFETEVHSWPPLVDVITPDPANTSLAEEDADEGGVVSSRPILYRKQQGVGEVLWWVAELEVPVLGKLYNKYICYTLYSTLESLRLT